MKLIFQHFSKKSNSKKLKNKKKLGCLSYPKFTRILFLGHNSWTKNRILVKIVSPLNTFIMYPYKKIQKFPVQIAFYETLPKFKKCLKN
jgi:hypothetical protein